MRTGDRIDVALDCVVEEKDGRRVARVFVRLADAPPSEGGARPPAPHSGAQRNVVQRWLGVADDQTFMAAFAIDLGHVEAAADLRALAAGLLEIAEQAMPELVEETRTFRVSGRAPVAVPEDETPGRTLFIDADTITVQIVGSHPVQVEISGPAFVSRSHEPAGYRSAKYAAIRLGDRVVFSTMSWVAEVANWAARRPRLNQPMVEKLRACAADTSPNWDGRVVIYPPEAVGLVELIDAVPKLASA